MADRVRFEAIEAFFAVYDEFQPLKRGLKHTRLTADEAERVIPGLVTDKLMGAVTFDEWGINGARLCNANALDAVAGDLIALKAAAADRRSSATFCPTR